MQNSPINQRVMRPNGQDRIEWRKGNALTQSEDYFFCITNKAWGKAQGGTLLLTNSHRLRYLVN
mgnify:CR=1 FL=1